MDHKLKGVRVIILAGGLGTRLRSVVSDVPKVLVDIEGKTILDRIITNLLKQGFYDIVLSVGYMKEKVREHIEKQLFLKEVKLNFLEEESALGTGGAIKRALNNFPCKTTLVLNGDTFFPIDYSIFVGKHIEKGAQASICLRWVDNVGDFGMVSIGEDNRITGFNEKTKEDKSGFINGGAYIFQKDIFEDFSLPEAFSIEKDFFEKYVREMRAYGFAFSDYFVDIGTPENYKKAKDYFQNGG